METLSCCLQRRNSTALHSVSGDESPVTCMWNVVVHIDDVTYLCAPVSTELTAQRAVIAALSIRDFSRHSNPQRMQQNDSKNKSQANTCVLHFQTRRRSPMFKRI